MIFYDLSQANAWWSNYLSLVPDDPMILAKQMPDDPMILTNQMPDDPIIKA